MRTRSDLADTITRLHATEAGHEGTPARVMARRDLLTATAWLLEDLAVDLCLLADHIAATGRHIDDDDVARLVNQWRTDR